jgi:DNA processing protein
MRSVKDLQFYLNWDTEKKNESSGQSKLFIELTADEEPIAVLLRKEGKMQIDLLCTRAAMPITKVVSTLFNLELKGAVRTHPGKVYEWLGA